MDQNDKLHRQPKCKLNPPRLSVSNLAIQRLRVNNEIQVAS